MNPIIIERDGTWRPAPPPRRTLHPDDLAAILFSAAAALSAGLVWWLL